MKASYDKASEIPPALVSEYEAAQDGKFYLKVEGEHVALVPVTAHSELKAKLSTFRDNNEGLNRQVTELTGKLQPFVKYTPEQIAAMESKLAGFEKGGAKDPSDIEKLMQTVADLNGKITGLETNLQKKDADLAGERHKLGLTTKATQLGVAESAIPYFLFKATQTFGVDGIPRDGDKVIYSKADPTKPMSVDEYVLSLKATEPNIFRPSTGGGAQPGAGDTPKKTISADPLEFGRNLAEIAKGTVQVVRPQ